MVNCKICNLGFDTDKSLHSHLRAHKTTMCEYYQTQYPRHDKYSGDLINFKNKEQYFATDFNNKGNLKSWLKNQTSVSQKEFMLSFMKDRIQKKGIKYSPSFIELKTLMCPPLTYYHLIFGNYYEFCSGLGLMNRFSYPKDSSIFQATAQLVNPVIYCDTREQNPLKFNLPSERRTVKSGDYCFNNPAGNGRIVFERKSLCDLIGTLSSGYDRFKREIERINQAGQNLVIIVEQNLEESLNFNKNHNISKFSKRVSPDFIFHKVRELTQGYDFIQFLFVNGRKESSRVIEKVYSTTVDWLSFDLQLLYHLSIL